MLQRLPAPSAGSFSGQKSKIEIPYNM